MSLRTHPAREPPPVCCDAKRYAFAQFEQNLVYYAATGTACRRYRPGRREGVDLMGHRATPGLLSQPARIAHPTLRPRRSAVTTGILSVIVFALLLVAAGAGPSAKRPSGRPLPADLASTPPMGWDSWNSFGCDIDEKKIRAAADALVSSGMRDAGYRYVIVDDCWYAPARDAAGNLRANPQRFPSGMAALGAYLHSRGLKFGLYMSPNASTCAQYTGSYPGKTGSGGHEYQDARTVAAWGVDYLKYDWCFPGGSVDGMRVAFATMRDALATTGRRIVYSINPNSEYPGTPGATQDWCGIATLTRTTQDIQPVWDGGNHNAFPMGIRNIIEVGADLAARVRPGCWNDPDMLEIGVRDVNGYAGLTTEEAKTHLAMWAMMAAPLISGNDLTTMGAQDRRILTSRDVLSVDQDPLGRAATRLAGGDHQIWTKPLVNGTAVALYNPTGESATLTTTLRQVTLPPGHYLVRDLWTSTSWTTDGEITATVPAHGTALLRLSPA